MNTPPGAGPSTPASCLVNPRSEECLASLTFSRSSGSKMFVGGLSWCTTKESLKAYFGVFGDIEDCTVVTNEQGRSRGFGFVTYRDPCVAFIVCQRGPHSVDNRVVDPKPCGPNGNHIKVPGRVMRPFPKIFTGGLPAFLTEDELSTFFKEKYGNVLEVVIMFDQESRRSRGFGFVTFQDEQVVEKICKEHFINIKGKKVECNRAQPRFLPSCSPQTLRLPFESRSSERPPLVDAQTSKEFPGTYTSPENARKPLFKGNWLSIQSQEKFAALPQVPSTTRADFESQESNLSSSARSSNELKRDTRLEDDPTTQ
ncbi:heterogeneous nuclear ribonucleoprotein 27C-like [Galendromus occidentalis]|uniref:Heterogeneous nuclear ribonucleoprotein 27C-like n=1 Tax=Galendromus occidentalis TaxID=34638 RepID=A0AAJ7WJ86_9ACAR|nr:heterogeneous nuclear ribonucleoprotein 27C-like [Galendromus occidentalis]